MTTVGRWISQTEYEMGNNPVSGTDLDGGCTDCDPAVNENNPTQLKEVVIRESHMTIDEIMTSITVNGRDAFHFSDGKVDIAARYRAESYGQYRETMSRQPQFDAWITNTAMILSGGELFELPGALYGLGRAVGSKLLARGLVVEAEIAVKGGTNLVAQGLGSTGRTVAMDLIEQLTMKEIVANPTLGRTVMTGMKDSRWLGWDKMQCTHTALDGTKTTIHYVGEFQKGILKAVDDFKFK